VFNLSDTDPGGEIDGVRVVASVMRGMTQKLTMLAGAAYYPLPAGEQRAVGMLGARTSLGKFSVLADAAVDHQGGVGAAFGLAGQPWDMSIMARHAEYRGGFIDEVNPAQQSSVPILRHSELSVDTSLKQGGRVIPLSMRAQREAYEDGAVALIAATRASSTIGTVFISGGLDYRRNTTGDGVSSQQLTGVLSASTFAAYKWQLRASLDYEIRPDPHAVALSLTADRAITERMALRFGVGHSFGEGGQTSLQAGANWRLDKGDLAVAADYATDDGDWRVGVQYAFGLAFDPFGRRYTMTRSGPASGGNLAFQAFVDNNGNGRFDPGEEPVPGVTVTGSGQPATTTANGRAFITGLGASPTGRVQVGLEEVDNPYLKAPPLAVEYTPRMGGVTRVMYPLTPTGEVMARVLFRSEDGAMVGLSAVRILVKREGADEPLEATTEFDGSVAFEGLPVGKYTLELEPEQAKRLNMRLRQSVTFTVAPEGGYLADVSAEVVFNAPTEALNG
jgi:hypothetical protein